MSEQAGQIAPAPGAGAAPPLVAAEASTARSSVVVSASFLLSSLFGGLLALLIAVIVGEGADADGFLAAYSAYLTFILFGSTLRASLVPLLGSTADEDRFREQATERLRRLLAGAGFASLLLLVSAPLLGRALVPSASTHAQNTAAASVAILAVAAYCQIWSAMLSAVLGAVRRFVASAILYVVASAVAVVLGSALMALIGISGAAIGVLTGSAVMLAGHVGYLRRLAFSVWPSWRSLRERATWSLTALAAAGASIPVALQLNATIALAAVSGETGAVTAYSYAYFLTVLATGITAGVISLVTMPGLLADIGERGIAASREYLSSTVPFVVFLYVPLAAGYAVFGRPFVDAVLLGPLSRENVDLLWDVSRIFLLMGLAWTMLAPLIAIVMSQGMYQRLALVSAGALVLQAALVIPMSSIGTLAVASAHAVDGTLVVVATLVVAFGRRSLAAAWDAIRRSLPALALGLVFPAVGVAGLASGAARSAAGLALASVLYLLLAVVLWRSVGGQAIRLLRAR